MKKIFTLFTALLLVAGSLFGQVAGDSAKRDALKQEISRCEDSVARSFLLQQLYPLAREADIDLYLSYVNDPLCAPMSVAALVALPGGDKALMDLVRTEGADKTLLCGAVADLKLREAEPYLLQWAQTAQGEEKKAICQTLGIIGSKASAKYLKSQSPADYMVLLDNLSDKEAVKAAKGLLKDANSGIRCAAVKTLIERSAPDPKLVVNALKTGDRPYRNAALAAAEKYDVGALAKALEKAYATLPDGAKTDVLNWLGVKKAASALPLVTSSIRVPGEQGETALRTLGILGGEGAAEALVSALSWDKSGAAYAALTTFEGNLTDAVAKALDAPENGMQLENLLRLCPKRHMTELAPAVLKLAASGNLSAAKALDGMATLAQADGIAALLDASAGEFTEPLQKALVYALHTETPEAQAEKLKGYLPAAVHKDKFYPALAAGNSDAAANVLREVVQKDASARDALFGMQIPSVMEDVLAAAREGGKDADKYLDRYVNLLSRFGKNDDVKRLGYAEVLSLASDPAVKESALGKIADMPLMKCFLLAGKYLDDSAEGVRYSAADAVRKIASQCKEEINYDDFKGSLEKAATLYRTRGLADDGYAVDEIGKMVSEAKPAPRSELTAEEKARGFEMLFDGSDLSKWHGDKEGYTVVNGAILVSALYGSTGNLYTNKQYRNFVYRFEFCFLEEGVNNGVGIRTPENVDAAYHGMCELQILDHDAPQYAGWLKDYQVHGSIYGIVPAKRLKHKPLGEWSTEEIIVKGDHITVTVNGEVITDADVRKVTKGGRKPTIDGKEHPGLFNKKGYISFCGHGSGLKIRNVRILDLGE